MRLIIAMLTIGILSGALPQTTKHPVVWSDSVSAIEKALNESYSFSGACDMYPPAPRHKTTLTPLGASSPPKRDGVKAVPHPPRKAKNGKP